MGGGSAAAESQNPRRHYTTEESVLRLIPWSRKRDSVVVLNVFNFLQWSEEVLTGYSFEVLKAKDLELSPGPFFAYGLQETQAAFFFCCARTLAHRARCAAAILFRAAWLMVRVGGDAFAPLAFAHRVLCASAILSRASSESFLLVLFAPV
jgi:hypothetical protein